MSDSEKPSVPWARQGAAPGTNPQGHWWRRVWNPALLRALWAHRNRAPNPSTAGSSPSLFPNAFRTGTWMVVVWIILLCLPLAGILLGYLRRPAAGIAGITTSGSTSEGSSDGAGKIPKPAPGKPMLPASQAPPPTVTSPTIPSPIAPVIPSPIATPQTALPPASTPVPPPSAPLPPPNSSVAGVPYAAVTYPARHDKHFGDECSGQLTLNSSGLYFHCPGEAVEAAVNQIDSVDDNGIRLLSGKKYHFTIPGMSKEGERAMFADWLNHVR